jgi:hypothetical protein
MYLIIAPVIFMLLIYLFGHQTGILSPPGPRRGELGLATDRRMVQYNNFIPRVEKSHECAEHA